LLTTNLLTGSDQEFEKALEVWVARKQRKPLPVNILGQSAVHLAVLSPLRLERLLQSGMDPDTEDGKKNTPINYSAA
jgi:hypothetical protein